MTRREAPPRVPDLQLGTAHGGRGGPAEAERPAATWTGRALYWGWLALAPLARSVSEERARAAARAAMDGAFRAWPAGRRAAIANARVLAEESDRSSWRHRPELLAREQFRRYGELLADTARLPLRTRRECHDAVAAPRGAWERLDRLDREGPLILALMHFGAWDVLGGAWAHHRARAGEGAGELHVLADPLGHPGLDAELAASRARLGMRTLQRRGGLRRALEVLRAGGTLAVLLDRPVGPRERRVEAELFGRPVRVSDLPGRLAVFTDAAVQPLAAVRSADDPSRFEGLIHAGPPLRGDAVSGLTQEVLGAFEPWLREHPDQWYHFRPVFRERGGR